MWRFAVNSALALALLSAVAPPLGEPIRPPSTLPSASLPRCVGSHEPGAIRFPRSPGGTPEVDAAWLVAHRCGVRVVDIREADEITGELGRIDVAAWVPLAGVEQAAESWDRDAPVVLVCRSGRRSERAADRLRSLGFQRVASLTGGMLAWGAASLPTTRAPVAAPTARPAATEAPAPSSSLAGLRATLTRPDALIWTRAATLLGANTVSCIDGREEAPVLGTPGGDAGELVLSLAALEQLLGRPLDPDWITAIFDRYVDAFGRFYLHTDRHAIERLADALRDDPRTAATAATWRGPEDIRAFVRSPPPAMEEALLEHLVEPSHVGCGHIRLMITQPSRYGVREGLVSDVLRAAFRRGWRRPELLEYAILDGEHEERGVLEVQIEHAVHAHTLVPMVAPHVGTRELFVLHPQVTAFVRAENAWFLVEQLRPAEAARVDAAALRSQITALGARQLAATVASLAPHLPHYRLRISAHGQTLEPISANAR